MRTASKTRKWICAGLASCGLMGLSLQATWGQNPAVPTAPPFKKHDLSPSLLDFVTGMPIGKTVLEMKTPKLMCEPFAGAPLTDPKGLASKIKANEVDAKNRIKAVKFLGTVDCISYPESQDVLIQTLQDDPVEDVRYASALAIQDQLKCGHQGKKLNKKELRRRDTCRGCCNDKIMKALQKVAYETDEFGCSLEPSARVRQAAADALGCCCDCWADPSEFVTGEEGTQVPPVYDEGKEAKPIDEGKEKSDSPDGNKASPQDSEKKAQSFSRSPKAMAGMGKSPVQYELDRIYARKGIRPPSTQTVRPVPETVDTVQDPVANLDARTPGLQPATSEIQQAVNPAAEATTLRPISNAVSVGQELPEVRALRGYCAVALKDEKFIKSTKQFASDYEGCRYYFSSAEAKAAFDKAPANYAPVMSANDVIEQAKSGSNVPGKFRCDYDGRMYFFATEANREQFIADPTPYSLPAVK